MTKNSSVALIAFFQRSVKEPSVHIYHMTSSKHYNIEKNCNKYLQCVALGLQSVSHFATLSLTLLRLSGGENII